MIMTLRCPRKYFIVGETSKFWSIYWEVIHRGLVNYFVKKGRSIFGTDKDKSSDGK